MTTKDASLARPALAALVLALSLGLAASGAQADTRKDNKDKKAAGSSPKKAPSNKVKFVPGSQETKAERAARLKRECKGAVNAGACQGYTQ